MNLLINTIKIDLRSKFQPIRDQGERPTCLSQSISSVHEVKLGSSFTLSVEYLHYFASGGKINEGATLKDAIKAIELEGQPKEVDCPSFAISPPANWKPPRHCNVYKSKSHLIHPLSLSSIYNSLQMSVPLVLGISLPPSFYHPRFPWIIEPNNTIIAYHAVVAAGISEKNGTTLVLIRNSWGTDWGDGGYAFLSDSFLLEHLIEALVLDS